MRKALTVSGFVGALGAFFWGVDRLFTDSADGVGWLVSTIEATVALLLAATVLLVVNVWQPEGREPSEQEPSAVDAEAALVESRLAA